MLLVLGLFSQNETKKWYFGNKAGLDFITNPPTVLINSAMNAMEACSTISDATGNLLFYTDGVTVWNKLHTVMANGTGLLGDPSTTQTLIVKQPGNSNIYFIFTADCVGQANGLRYTTVDMNLAVGIGSVTIKNTLIVSPSTEKIVGTRHCNGIDIWVITHDYPGNTFRANLVTSSGVGTSILSSVGGIVDQGGTQGYLKISPSGKKIGLARCSMNGSNTFPLEVYDFDNSTGIVFNSLIVKMTIQAYGCEFSSDESKFYACHTPGTTRISQWDLCAGSNTAIVASEYTFAASGVGAMQLGPNGKIYVSISGQFTGVFNNPNVGGVGCNYFINGQPIAPNNCTYGMPNFVYPKLQVQPFTYTVSPAISCLTASFTSLPPPTITVTACTSVGYSLTNMLWDFGDPSSGSANTSTFANPTHNYPGPGNYTAQLIYYYTCGGGTDTLKQQVVVGAMNVNSPQNFQLCNGQTLTLSATGNLTYTWSTGQNTNNINVSPTVNTTYTVYGTDMNGCANMAIKTITVNSLPTIIINGSNSTCIGSSIIQTASGGNTYTWSTGSNTSTVNLTPSLSTIYSVLGADMNNCMNSATVNISVIPLPIITTIGSTALCVGSTISQTASGAITYLWNTGVITNTINLAPTVNTTYTVYGTDTLGCIGQQTVSVIVNPLPIITTSGNTIICIGSIVTQTANGANTYTWNTGENTTTVNLTPTINSTYTVYGTNISGCTNQQTVSVTVNSLPTITASGNNSICIGFTVNETASGANSYTWNTGENTNVVSFTPSINTVYSVSGSDINGCVNTTTVLITVNSTIPITSFSYPLVCQNDINTLPITINGFNSGGIFFSNNLNIDANTGQINLNLTNAGTYPVTYSVLINGCLGSNTTSLIILPVANLNLNPSINITPGSSTTLSVTGGTSYTWSPANYLSCIECENPLATPPENMQYCVTSELNSCISKACTDIIVTCETNNDYSVPNAFTPNGDNNNDIFCLQGWDVCITNFNVMIFDRWGEKVYESTNFNFCWDGIYNGKLLDAAVFVYVINATKLNKDKINKKGNITLIR